MASEQVRERARTMKSKKFTVISGLGLLSLAWPTLAGAQEAPPTPEQPATSDAVTSEEPAPVEAPAAVEEPAPDEPVVTPPAPESGTSAEPGPVATAEAAVAAEEAPKGYLDPKINIGTGLRVGYTVSADPIDHSIGTNIRPYINGQVSKHIKFEGNLDSDIAVITHDGGATETVATLRVLDAVIKLELDDLVNFWVGRFLPPSDRANLSGPYFQNSWNYPVQANLFPAIYAGRHDGLAYWGQIKGGLFKWQVGMFDATGSDHNPLLAGRLVLNLLDPEGGYYNSSTYYGAKDILAIGGTIHYQKDGVPGTGIDGAALEAEVLFEKPINDGASGTFTAEGTYYNFNDVDQGQSVVGNLSYLLPGKQGPGALQPQARLQVMIPQTGDSYATLDGAINYIVDGHNCRFTLNYQHIAPHDGIDADNLITLGGQIQMF